MISPATGLRRKLRRLEMHVPVKALKSIRIRVNVIKMLKRKRNESQKRIKKLN
jgi:hypothetical protein